MPAREFIDTNVLVYSCDRHDPRKHSRAQEVLNSGMEDETAVLSVQVLGEFFNVVTKRIPNPLSISEAEEVMDLVAILPVVDVDMPLVRRAIHTHRQYGITYWDSLIVAAAERAGCGRILSEDLNPGQAYHDIVVVNPFEVS